MSDAIRLEYEVPGDDFTRAGEASSDVKRLLKKLGVAPGAVRRVAIALYEGEINLAYFILCAPRGAVAICFNYTTTLPP